ncbi:MAG: single-stranded-DNA-specific exonuclease [Myxococcota bacterium]|jgi:single-stranded-DNA-specific exonuclease
MIEREWIIQAPDPGAIARLIKEVGVSDVVAGLMVNRGIVEPAEARDWLAPRLRDLEDPAGLRDMQASVELLLSHLDAGNRVTIYGDYDVDGMTASSTLARFLRLCGYAPQVFLPDRFRDGYGVNVDRVRDLVEEGTRLFVTVDCGVTAVQQITVARELGADFIVVDHHQLPEGDLPPANAIINPHHPDCTFPFDDLCAAGLAFHLVMALRVELRKRGHFDGKTEPDVRDLLDIVAIGTIADVVPLRGINRILVANGLLRLPHSPHPGVRALTALSARSNKVNAGTVAFQIGPRLNAAGRLSHPMKGFEILATDDPERAQAIATDIDEENKRRRVVQDQIEEQALEQALSQQGEHAAAYVLWDETWHPGVAGIVAARMVQRFHRPCAVLAVADGIAKGSIRSIKGFDAVAGLRRCADVLKQFGGHAHAAGVTVELDNLPAFRAAFEKAARDTLKPEDYVPRLKIDAAVRFPRLDGQLLDEFERMAPFGAGNPEPRLCTHNATVVRTRTVGADGSHLKLWLEDDGIRLDAIAFGWGDRAPAAGASVDVAYRPEFNEWQGNVSLQLRIVDMKVH